MNHWELVAICLAIGPIAGLFAWSYWLYLSQAFKSGRTPEGSLPAASRATEPLLYWWRICANCLWFTCSASGLIAATFFVCGIVFFGLEPH